MLGKRTHRTLVAIHLASAGLWLGGLGAIVLLLAVGPSAPESRARFGLDLGAHAIHDTLLFWAFVVTVVTGLGFATLTTWGTFRHHWVTAKWLLATALFVVTLWFENPALAIVAGLSDAGTSSLAGMQYAEERTFAIALSIGQLLVVLAIFWLSAVKPWGQRARDVSRRWTAIVAVAGILIGGSFGLFGAIRLAHIRALPADDIAVGSRADGTWRGGVEDCGVPYEVEAVIRGGGLVDVRVLRTSPNRYGTLGTAVLPRIVAANSTRVDAITGATTSSRCLIRATGRALRDADRHMRIR
jgi:uncharacterized protein with FMN-binding domain